MFHTPMGDQRLLAPVQRGGLERDSETVHLKGVELTLA